MEYGTRVELTDYGHKVWSFTGHGTVVDTNHRLPFIEVLWDSLIPMIGRYDASIPMMGMEIKKVPNE